MTRLQRDIPATIAALRITRFDLTVFVESKENDSFIYQKLTETCSSDFGKSIEIRESQEVLTTSSSSGGKTILEALFRAAETQSLLRVVNSSGSHSLAFIVDKDVDDVIQRAIIHPHVIYTSTYHVENLLVLAGNLKLAVAAALSLDETELRLLSTDWEQKVKIYSVLWKSWVILCLLSIKLRIKFVTTYGVTSQVNIPLSAPSDRGLFAQNLTSLQTRCQVNSTIFNEELLSVEELVNSIYSVGAQDSIFKGKWYVDIVVDEAIQLGLTPRSKASGQKEVIWGILRATFDTKHPSLDYLRQRIRFLMI